MVVTSSWTSASEDDELRGSSGARLISIISLVHQPRYPVHAASNPSLTTVRSTRPREGTAVSIASLAVLTASRTFLSLRARVASGLEPSRKGSDCASAKRSPPPMAACTATRVSAECGRKHSSRPLSSAAKALDGKMRLSPAEALMRRICCSSSPREMTPPPPSPPSPPPLPQPPLLLPPPSPLLLVAAPALLPLAASVCAAAALDSPPSRRARTDAATSGELAASTSIGSESSLALRVRVDPTPLSLGTGCAADTRSNALASRATPSARCTTLRTSAGDTSLSAETTSKMACCRCVSLSE
mmetsp:Transcript_4285/g.8399  ORF Transcript_4285/g.8399 Transcript_4285/m.8399 type:complete len:301 (-) Transcript_4285:129-1031(-)